MGDGGKSAPVAKSSQQNPSGILIHVDSSEGYLWNILGVSMSPTQLLCHWLCKAGHCCFGVTGLGDRQRSRAHKASMAAAPHGVTSHLQRGDTPCHLPVPPAQHTQGSGAVGCWQDLVMGRPDPACPANTKPAGREAPKPCWIATWCPGRDKTKV